MSPTPSVMRLIKAALAGLALCTLAPSVALRAETRTLTDKQGRSLKAEIVSVDGDKVTIKREDGQTFVLALSNLSDDDQKSLKAWAAQDALKPKPLPADAIKVQLSRAIFDTEKRKVDVTLVGGGKVKDGMTVTKDKWGYEVTIANTTGLPINNLRAEYILFATMDDIHATGKEGLKQRPFKTSVPPVPALSRVSFRTETITAIKEKFNGNIVAAGSGATSSKETLYGVWMRLYQGDQLVYEVAMPTSLSTTEKWR